MKISGEFTVNATRDKVWETLNDIEALGSMIPGAKGLTEVGPDEYTASMDLGIGPIRTSFTGKVRISERDEPNSYKLQVEGEFSARLDEWDGQSRTRRCEGITRRPR